MFLLHYYSYAVLVCLLFTLSTHLCTEEFEESIQHNVWVPFAFSLSEKREETMKES